MVTKCDRYVDIAVADKLLQRGESAMHMQDDIQSGFAVMSWRVISRVSLLTKSCRSDRGDVPGWVLVTVMTAGLVVALWSVADGQLRSILGNALQSVSQP